MARRYVVIAVAANDSLWSEEFESEGGAEYARTFLEQQGVKLTVIEDSDRGRDRDPGRDDDDEDDAA